jgi:hypothetical protein
MKLEAKTKSSIEKLTYRSELIETWTVYHYVKSSMDRIHAGISRKVEIKIIYVYTGTSWL